MDILPFHQHKVKTCMAMQKIVWMIFFLFNKFFFFKKLVSNEMFVITRHLLVLNGHGSHFTLQIMKHAQEFRLDMITLPSHTSHALQTLNVFCFKPFKISFRKVRDVTMYKNNHMELNNITLVGCVN
jgi:hypothetical protein